MRKSSWIGSLGEPLKPAPLSFLLFSISSVFGITRHSRLISYLSCPQSWSQPFLRGAQIPFSWKTVLETKIWVPDVLIGVDLHLGHFGWQESTYVYKHTFKYMCVCVNCVRNHEFMLTSPIPTHSAPPNRVLFSLALPHSTSVSSFFHTENPGSQEHQHIIYSFIPYTYTNFIVPHLYNYKNTPFTKSSRPVCSCLNPILHQGYVVKGCILQWLVLAPFLLLYVVKLFMAIQLGSFVKIA